MSSCPSFGFGQSGSNSSSSSFSSSSTCFSSVAQFSVSSVPQSSLASSSPCFSSVPQSSLAWSSPCFSSVPQSSLAWSSPCFSSVPQSSFASSSACFSSVSQSSVSSAPSSAPQLSVSSVSQSSVFSAPSSAPQLSVCSVSQSSVSSVPQFSLSGLASIKSPPSGFGGFGTSSLETSGYQTANSCGSLFASSSICSSSFSFSRAASSSSSPQSLSGFASTKSPPSVSGAVGSSSSPETSGYQRVQPEVPAAQEFGETNAQVSLRILIDKKENRVFFAEARKDFVDVLLSFLTLPLGTIARLVCKDSDVKPVNIGSLSSLYESLKNLDGKLFWTETCKDMLLLPRNSMEAYCRHLKLNIDDTDPTKYFICQNWNCSRRASAALLSTFENKRCSCGNMMNQVIPLDSSLDSGQIKGGYVHETVAFIISDDLMILPDDLQTSVILLQNLGIVDMDVIGEMTVNDSQKEIFPCWIY